MMMSRLRLRLRLPPKPNKTTLVPSQIESPKTAALLFLQIKHTTFKYSTPTLLLQLLKKPTKTMRISCNGCRVLRKGCTDDCTIRPCLQWISNSDSQAHATLFLAKFYGRAGLINLINAGPQHLRPGIFRSLLYEACGRIVNPIYGSVGLLWSGNWNLCQAAVESVLKGAPINPVAAETAAQGQGPPLKAYDIRHVVKDENSAASADLVRVKTRCRVVKSKPRRITMGNEEEEEEEVNRSASHDQESTLSHHRSVESGSTVSVETESGGLVGLELTLGFEPSGGGHVVVPVKKRRRGCEFTWEEEEEKQKQCRVDLVLELGAQI